MPYLNTACGGRIHYETVGEGPPLVFIHGWAMSGEVWRFQEGLAETYRLIFPDLRGHGFSSAPATGYRFQDFADDLLELFIALRLENAILIGWSMGAQVALQAFPDLRSRLAAVVLVSGTPRFTATEGYTHGQPEAAVKRLALLLQRDFSGTVADFFKRMFVDDELGARLPGHIFSEENKIVQPAWHAVRQALKSLATTDLRAELALVDVPVLLIHGGGDSICIPSASQYMAEHLRDARLEIMAGAGHAPFMSRPGEFAGILTEFLDGIYAHD
jgi:non-heme chloroperoxidase